MNDNEKIIIDIKQLYSSADPSKIRHLIAKHFIPTVTEKKQNAEIPTPVKLVDEMLSTIPAKFWTTPKRVFEPCCGKGNFVLGIFDKFYKGLENNTKYKKPKDRCKVIIQECLYYADITELNVFVTTEILKCHIQSLSDIDITKVKFNTYVGDTLLKKKVYKALKLGTPEDNGPAFDAVIGNPPYSTDPSNPSTVPLYDKFIEKYIDEKMLLFVVPSRWFVGGKGLNKFRSSMMKRKDILFINHIDDSKEWFGNTINISGGVNYFLKDSSYKGECLFNGVSYDLSKYDAVIKTKYHKVIDVVSKMENINKLYMGRYFGIETNDKRLKDEGKVKCYVSVKKSVDRIMYLDKYDFNEENTFWKVITARAGMPGFGAKFIGKPHEIHSGSYISFKVNSKDEAESLLSYLETPFANYMLMIRKISQDISENTCKWIPLVPLDRIWTNDKVCKYLKIKETDLV